MLGSPVEFKTNYTQQNVISRLNMQHRKCEHAFETTKQASMIWYLTTWCLLGGVVMRFELRDGHIPEQGTCLCISHFDTVH
jgi:hypothetical protein